MIRMSAFLEAIKTCAFIPMILYRHMVMLRPADDLIIMTHKNLEKDHFDEGWVDNFPFCKVWGIGMSRLNFKNRIFNSIIFTRIKKMLGQCMIHFFKRAKGLLLDNF